MLRTYLVCLTTLSCLTTSCATYHVTTTSLLEQLAATRPEKKVSVLVVFPFFFPTAVSGNSLRELKCLDQHGQEETIRVTSRTGVRITKTDKTRDTFYFDTLLVQDSTISGAKSHFATTAIKPIKLREVEKIELQK